MGIFSLIIRRIINVSGKLAHLSVFQSLPRETTMTAPPPLSSASMKESLITPPLIHLKDMKGCRDSHVIKLLFWAVQFILGSVVTAVAMLEKENCFCFAGFL